MRDLKGLQKSRTPVQLRLKWGLRTSYYSSRQTINQFSISILPATISNSQTDGSLQLPPIIAQTADKTAKESHFNLIAVKRESLPSLARPSQSRYRTLCLLIQSNHRHRNPLWSLYHLISWISSVTALKIAMILYRRWSMKRSLRCVLYAPKRICNQMT